MKFFFPLILILFITISTQKLVAQEVYQHVSNTDIYEFIDELANAQVITINSSVKPYSRILIAHKLFEAGTKKEKLNPRQNKELAFYLKDYNKELMPDAHFDKRRDLFFYKDSLFTLSFNPILGISVYSNDTAKMFHRWNGAEAFSYVGKNVGIYASLRDNYENKRLAGPGFLNNFQGADYKLDGHSEAGEYSEMRGGITYSWNWGTLGMIKDHFVWGDNYHGANIFSGHAPSITHLKLHIHPVAWLDFNYVHGWLISEVVDSNNSYLSNPGYRLVFHPKYVAANLLTITPFKNLDISVGNSIIYSDKNVQPAYLIPFFFYKSVDHTQSGAGSNWLSENSQMFFNISSRQFKNIHLYTSVFIDEISFSTMFDERTQSNIISAKIGARLSNFLVDDFFLTAEYTRSNPLVYKHYISTATFESNFYNLGHYLGDNAQEIFLSAAYKPFAKFSAEISYSIAQKGAAYPYTGQAGTDGSGQGLSFIKNVYWQASEVAVHTQYQVINDCYVFAGILISDHHGVDVDTYTQPYFRGKRTTVNIGANVGF